jgi:hypothetical protein
MSDEAKTEVPNFAEMTDEQIMSMEEPFGAPPANEEASAEADVPSEEVEASQPTPEDEGGAELEEGSPDVSASEDDAVDESAAEAPADPYSAEASDSSEDDQSEDEAEEVEAATETQQADGIDYEAAYKELMSPFRAARKEVNLESIDDARRLMQMGVDYSRKMEAMKPHLRILRTLEKAGLTDPEKVNFLIDLNEKNPDAIRKLLKDSSIDPMDLDLEDSTAYKPNDHSVTDVEANLHEAFDSIRELPSFQKTLDTFGSWDTASKQILQDNPTVIPIIAQHIDDGLYDKVWAKVESERLFGRLAGLSDLDAYYAVGEAMHQQAMANAEAPSATPNAAQASAQGNGSPNGSTARKSQKRAASPTRGRAASGRKGAPDFSKMSDDDILNMDISSFT